jgi:hypothetical protein
MKWLALALLVLAACGSMDDAKTETAAPSTRILVGAERSPDASQVAPGHPIGLPSAIEKRTRWGHVFVPEGFWSNDGAYDLMIHFHGAPATVESAFRRSQVNAVLYVMNLGDGPGRYEDRFQSAEALTELLASLQDVVAKLGIMDAPIVRHVALSSWSAGYAATRKILSHELPNSVDAVLLADGLHAPFLDKRARKVDAPSMDPYVDFAQAAARGERFMSVAHSGVRTASYASTSETSAYLTRALGLEVANGEFDSPATLRLTSIAGRGKFIIRGYEGNDEQAHAEHLKQIDATLWLGLRERWTSVALPETSTAQSREPNRYAWHSMNDN